MSRPRARRRLVAGLLAASCALSCPGCTAQGDPRPTSRPAPSGTGTGTPESSLGEPARHRSPEGRVTLAFVGDMHFQIQLAGLLEHPRGALGRIARTLGAADVTMANLESAVTTRGSLDPKELEKPERRFWFRASPAAFDVLRGAGIDVVTMANNHGADYGPVGLADSLRAARRSPLGVVGIGRDRRAAFAPYRVVVGETHLAFLAADTSPRESTSSVWSAGPNSPGIADARAARPRPLLMAVREAARRDDVVVVYVHWGTEGARCPDPRQRSLARLLSRAGADVVVGTHAHVLQGAGWIRHTYVDYGLANFLWYHDGEPDTGILQVHIEDGAVVDDSWAPAEIQPLGRVEPLAGRERKAAIEHWRGRRSCTGLAAEPVA